MFCHHVNPGWLRGNSCIVQQNVDSFSSTDSSNLVSKWLFQRNIIFQYLLWSQTVSLKTVKLSRSVTSSLLNNISHISQLMEVKPCNKEGFRMLLSKFSKFLSMVRLSTGCHHFPNSSGSRGRTEWQKMIQNFSRVTSMGPTSSATALSFLDPGLLSSLSPEQCSQPTFWSLQRIDFSFQITFEIPRN